MKTEELIKTFQALDARKRNVDVRFITPNGKVMDIDNVSLLSSISTANGTPKLTFYVYLKEMQHSGWDTQGAAGTPTLFQKTLNNSECEKQLTRLCESHNRTAMVYPRRFA